MKCICIVVIYDIINLYTEQTLKILGILKSIRCATIGVKWAFNT